MIQEFISVSYHSKTNFIDLVLRLSKMIEAWTPGLKSRLIYAEEIYQQKTNPELSMRSIFHERIRQQWSVIERISGVHLIIPNEYFIIRYRD